MTYKLQIAGSGGQGVMLFGQLLGYTACEVGLHVTYFPAYGAEQRGGTANCTVIISDDPIGAPKVDLFNGLMLMNQPSFDRFADDILPGGTVFTNSNLVTDIHGKKGVHEIPALSEAIALSSAMAANMVLLGYFVTQSGVLPFDAVQKMVKKKLSKRPELEEVNRRALERGRELALARA